MKYMWMILAVLAACTTERNPEACCTTDEDCADFGLPPGSGCPDGFACVNRRCTAASCDTDSDCGSQQPVCSPETKSCSSCGDASDCVSYTNEPVCDPATGGCRACRIDAECPSDVCDIDTGACVAADDIIYAAPNGFDTDPCTQSRPCSLSRAFAAAVADTPSMVRMVPGTYGTSVTISTGTIVVVGTGAVLQGSPGGGSSLLINGAADVSVRGLAFDTTVGTVGCNGSPARGRLTLRDVSIEGGKVTAVVSCVLTLRDVRLASNAATGSGAIVVVDDAELDVDRLRLTGTSPTDTATIYAVGQRMVMRIVNSVFDNAAIDFSPTDDMMSKSRLELAFNTAFAPFTNPLKGCSATSNVNKTTLVENNIFMSASAQNAIDGPRCTTAHNILFPQAAALPGGNIVADPLLVDPANHDLRIRGGSPAVDAAVPSTGLSPDHDFAGAPRPRGARPDIGAFELDLTP